MPLTPRIYRQTKRAEQAAQTRSRILAAARELLAERGYSGVTLEDVAERAAVTRKTVHERFGTKARLLRAVVDDVVERQGIESWVRDVLDEPDADIALRRYVELNMKVYEEEAPALRALRLVADVDSDAAEAVAYGNKGRRRDLACLVDRIAGEGRLRAGWTPRRATEALWAATSFETFDFARRRAGRSFAATVDVVHSLVLAVVAEPGERSSP
jgi:AcrR family transcriptional regulator